MMRLTPQTALDTLNTDIAKAFSPLVTKVAEEAVSRFVQAGLDAFVERGHLDVTVKFSLKLDPKKGQYMAFLSGTF